MGMSGGGGWETSAMARSTKPVRSIIVVGKDARVNAQRRAMRFERCRGERIALTRTPVSGLPQASTIDYFAVIRDQGAGRMTDLSRLVEAPACSSLPYIGPAFPNRPLGLPLVELFDSAFAPRQSIRCGGQAAGALLDQVKIDRLSEKLGGWEC
jgi:hypothetical protein